jgi:hypothetical protein
MLMVVGMGCVGSLANRKEKEKVMPIRALAGKPGYELSLHVPFSTATIQQIMADAHLIFIDEDGGQRESPEFSDSICITLGNISYDYDLGAGLTEEVLNPNAKALIEWGTGNLAAKAEVDWIGGRSFCVNANSVRVTLVVEGFYLTAIPNIRNAKFKAFVGLACLTPELVTNTRQLVIPGPGIPPGTFNGDKPPSYATSIRNIYRTEAAAPPVGIDIPITLRFKTVNGIDLGGVVIDPTVVMGPWRLPNGTAIVEIQNNDPVRSIRSLSIVYGLEL